MSDEKHEVNTQVEISATKKPIFDEDQNTPLHFAAARGFFNEIIAEVENGHKIDVENSMGWTPLMMATRNNHLDIVQYLLNKRADATRKNSFGGSVFFMAIASGNYETIDLILEHLLSGGVSKQSMESICSPISIAILFNQPGVFRYLLDKSFSINAISQGSKLTPLMFASLNENSFYSLFLQHKGANPNLQNASGDTAQDIINKKRGPFKEPAPMMPAPIPQIFVFSSPGPGPGPGGQYPMPFLPHNNNIIRKSSNALTPNYICSPALTPITPINYPQRQFFFPQDFAMEQYGYSPVFGYCSGNYPQGTIISPVMNMPYSNPHPENYIVNIGTPIVDNRLPPEP